MNYYRRHLGDYAKDTGHLSALEHGVFNLLLDWYYASEAPIPSAKAYRIAKASTAVEKSATDAVLADFFHRDGEVWRNRRADEEIQEAQSSLEDAELRRENEKERQRRHRQRRKELFAALREQGLIPSYDTPTTELDRMLSRVTKRDGHATVTPQVTRDATAIHNSNTPIQDLRSKTAAAPPVSDFKADLFARWKSLPDGGGGAFLNKLFRDHKPEQRVMEAVERTLDDTRADPKAFVLGVLNTEARAESAHDALMARVQ